MEYRTLGRSGLKVSAFSFGTATFGGTGMHASLGSTTGGEATRQIDMCLDAGINLFDTADMYSSGRAEELLGEALGKRRSQVLVTTKAFFRMGDGVNDLGASRYHLIRACEASLKRLGSDYIDLYQVHNQDLLTPPEETLRALDDLISSGKVRYIGSSNYSAWYMMKSLATSDRLGCARYVSQEVNYSLMGREAEWELLPLGIDQGVGALIWGPTASGYLSGKFRDGVPSGSTRIGAMNSIATMNGERGHRILDAMDEIAQARPGVSLSQIALNWVVRKRGVSSVIIGARTSQQLADNLQAASWSLSDSEIERLDAASAMPLPQPYSMQAGDYGHGRNPSPSLLPPL